jgi:sugar phosphate isomerase/epimerase
MDINIVDWFGYNLPPQERIRLIKDAGFSGIVGLLWQDDYDKDYKSFPEYADNAGLYIENIHSPWWGYNDLWLDNKVGQDFTEKIVELVKICSFYKIPTLVMHPEHKNKNEYIELPVTFNIGLERLNTIVDAAERFNVNIAMENMCRPEYLEVIFNNIHSKRLGFCFDSGHWNVFMPEIDLLTLYGDRLMALHLHDNDGNEDWHALPCSGNIDWKYIADKLKDLNYNGAIALEVGNKTFENIKEPSEFLKLAFERTSKIFSL